MGHPITWGSPWRGTGQGGGHSVPPPPVGNCPAAPKGHPRVPILGTPLCFGGGWGAQGGGGGAARGSGDRAVPSPPSSVLGGGVAGHQAPPTPRLCQRCFVSRQECANEKGGGTGHLSQGNAEGGGTRGQHGAELVPPQTPTKPRRGGGPGWQRCPLGPTSPPRWGGRSPVHPQLPPPSATSLGGAQGATHNRPPSVLHHLGGAQGATSKALYCVRGGFTPAVPTPPHHGGCWGGVGVSGQDGGAAGGLLLLVAPLGHLVVDGHLQEATGLHVGSHLLQRLRRGGGHTTQQGERQGPVPPGQPPHLNPWVFLG